MNVYEESFAYYDEHVHFLRIFSKYERFSKLLYTPYSAKRTDGECPIFHVSISKNFQQGTLNHVLELLRWVYEKLLYTDDAVDCPMFKTALEVLEYAERYRKNVSCYAHAIVLTEILLYYGYWARTIHCLPMGTFPYDVHCVTIVFVNELQKWVMLDPTFNIYICDEHDSPISLPDMRSRIIEGKKVIPCSNNRFKSRKIDKLIESYMKYMVKNLFCFYYVFNEGPQFVDSYLLYPMNYLPYDTPVEIKTYGKKRIHYIRDDDFFWETSTIK